VLLSADRLHFDASCRSGPLCHLRRERIGQIARIDFLDEAIDRLSAEVERRVARFTLQRDLLMTVPGVKRRTAGS
jgi:transposase